MYSMIARGEWWDTFKCNVCGEEFTVDHGAAPDSGAHHCRPLCDCECHKPGSGIVHLVHCCDANGRVYISRMNGVKL